MSVRCAILKKPGHFRMSGTAYDMLCVSCRIFGKTMSYLEETATRNSLAIHIEHIAYTKIKRLEKYVKIKVHSKCFLKT